MSSASDTSPASLAIERIEQIIRRDPARRGLIGSEAEHGPLCLGHLEAAARSLAASAQHVAIVTGFYVPHAVPPAAETDGPLGSLMLAHALRSLGATVTLITDEYCVGALRAGAQFTGLPEETIVAAPHETSAWTLEFLSAGPGRSLTHLIALERCGPSHTDESINAQAAGALDVLERFYAVVPAELRGLCYNMLGRSIQEHTAELYRLFEELPRHLPQARSIGIGDGGNEIGMGSILWDQLQRRLDGAAVACIPCRIATDWNIIAGTSNWGGYALAAAVLLLRDRVDVVRDWDAGQQQRLLEHIVKFGPAVDGITGRQEATVDGLPFVTYIQAWEAIRRVVGLDD